MEVERCGAIVERVVCVGCCGTGAVVYDGGDLVLLLGLEGGALGVML
jgi:hypothetical protein